MTKANSILHRAAALLAALCLLASMALPVYAAETETDFSVSNSETIPDDDNTGNGADGTGSDISVSNLETIQKDADTTNEGSKTEPEISVPESGTIPSGADTTDKAAGAPLTEGVTGSENTAPATMPRLTMPLRTRPPMRTTPARIPPGARTKQAS